MREINKPRRAKYGFQVDYFSISTIVPAGMLIAGLRARFDSVKYDAELTNKVDGTSQLKLYTDHDDVAEFVRSRLDTFDPLKATIAATQ